MKRLMPNSLIEFLAANRNCQKADLFAITLPTGQTIYITSGQWDITVPFGTPGWNGNEDPSLGFQTTTFSALGFGKWTRGTITSEASFSLAAGKMSLTCAPAAGITYPGLNAGLLKAALNGLFDGSLITVWTVYMPAGPPGSGYGAVSAGVETKFFGTITSIAAVDRVHVEFSCSDPLYLLNMKVPMRLIQSTCPWSFADSNCAVAGGAAAFTQAFTADTPSTQWTLVPTSLFTGARAAAGYFEQGTVKCLTGNNKGLAQTIKTSANNALGMMVPWLLPIQAGDTFSVIAGCDKSAGTCQLKFNNLIHFGGAPYCPVPTTAI